MAKIREKRRAGRGLDPALTLGLLKAISATHLPKVSAGLTDIYNRVE